MNKRAGFKGSGKVGIVFLVVRLIVMPLSFLLFCLYSIVDSKSLPAKVSKKQREAFGHMIEEYITSRKQLRGVISLVDALHDPSDDDISMYEWLHYYNIPILVVATKSDKISRSRFNKYESNIKRTLGFDKEDSDFQFFSSETKYGKDEVWQWIEAHLNQM